MTHYGSGAAILVVDDEHDSLETLRLLLCEEGFDAHGAGSAAEALEMIERWKPDALIVDIMMPGMNGFEVCEQLRARADTRHIPIIACTGYPLQLHSNPDLYDRMFLKPADFAALTCALRELLRLNAR